MFPFISLFAYLRVSRASAGQLILKLEVISYSGLIPFVLPCTTSWYSTTCGSPNLRIISKKAPNARTGGIKRRLSA